MLGSTLSSVKPTKINEYPSLSLNCSVSQCYVIAMSPGAQFHLLRPKRYRKMPAPMEMG